MSTRLDKFLCHNLGISRTQAKQIIRQGRVKVKERTEKNAGLLLEEHSEVRFDDALVSAVGLEYYLLNKPVGFVCTNKEGLHPMVFDLLDLVRPEKYHAAGRLDIDSTGLVLITNDGQWSHRVTSPSKKLGKTYLVTLAEPVNAEQLQPLEKGLILKGETKSTSPALIELISDSEVRITVYEGKYHQVKRMFAAIGNKVETLHRERIGDLSLDESLEPGHYRTLTSKEVNCIDV